MVVNMTKKNANVEVYTDVEVCFKIGLYDKFKLINGKDFKNYQEDLSRAISKKIEENLSKEDIDFLGRVLLNCTYGTLNNINNKYSVFVNGTKKILPIPPLKLFENSAFNKEIDKNWDTAKQLLKHKFSP